MNTRPHLEIIIGTMFSGKSTELIRRINRYEIAGKTVQLFKPTIDDRYSLEHVTSHDGLKRDVTYVKDMNDLYGHLDSKKDVLGLDEIQFLESEVVELCNQYANDGGIVVVSGLLKDFRDEYFPFKDGQKNMSDLLRDADHVTYLKAICTYKDNGENICGNEATRVQRFIDEEVAAYDSPVIQVGGTEAYAPRCRNHFQFYKK